MTAVMWRRGTLSCAAVVCVALLGCQRKTEEQKTGKPSAKRAVEAAPAAAYIGTVTSLEAARGEGPSAAVEPLPPLDELIFISNEGSGSISVIDSRRDVVIRSISVGKRPRGLVVVPDGSVLYVALSGSPRGGPGVDPSILPPPEREFDGIGVVDLKTFELRTKLDSGDDPECFDFTPDGRLLLVANEDAARATLLTPAGQLIATFQVGVEPEGVRFTPDGRHAYVASEADHRIDIIDVERRAHVGTVPTGKRPRTIEFTPDGKLAFVAAESSGQVDVIDVERRAVTKSIHLPGQPEARPMGLALDPERHRLYVSTGRAGRVAVVDTKKLEVISSIDDVGVRPWGVALGPKGSKLYTANGPSNDVTIIDTRTGNRIGKIRVGELPWGAAPGRPVQL